MAKQIVEELIGVLGLEVNDASFKDGNRALKDTGVSFTQVAAAAVAAATAIQAVVTGMVLSFAESADASGKFASRIGVTVEGLTSLRHAVQQTSSATEQQFNTGLQRMTRRIAEANAGSKELSKVFNELGLDVSKLAALAPDQQFLAISDAMNTLNTNGEQVRATFKIFDTEGVELINTMRKGSDAIRELQQEARELGIVLSDDDAKAAAEFNDQMDIARKSMGGVANEIGRNLLPAFTELAVTFSTFVKDNRELIQSGLLRFFDLFAFAMKAAAVATGLFVAFKIGTVLLGAGAAMRGLALATMSFNVSALLLPILIGLAAAAIVGIGQDIFTYVQHGDKADTMTGRLLAKFEELGKVGGVIRDIFVSVGTAIGETIGFAVIQTQKLIDNFQKLNIFGGQQLGPEYGATIAAGANDGSFIPPEFSQVGGSSVSTSSIINNVHIDATGMDRNELNAAIDMRTGQQNAESLRANSTGKAF